MRTLYWLKYNNYYNRLVKKENTLSDYLTTDRLILTSSGVNFYPNDGIDTEIVYNGNKYELPDYLLVVNGDELESRWFVIEGKSTAGKQFSLTLHRDILVDEYDNYVNAPCFIEKATLSKNDPLIFNKENMSVNQIKKSETLLKDETQCPWIVGYISRNYEGGQINFSGAPQEDIVVANLTDYNSCPALKYTASSPYRSKIGDYDYHFFYAVQDKNLTEYYNFNKNGKGNYDMWPKNFINGNIFVKDAEGGKLTNYQPTDDSISSLKNTVVTSSNSYYFTEEMNILTQANLQAVSFTDEWDNLYQLTDTYLGITGQMSWAEFNSYNGKIIKDSSSDKYYKLSVIIDHYALNNYTSIIPASGALYVKIKELLDKWKEQQYSSIFGEMSNKTAYFRSSLAFYKVELIELKKKSLYVTIPKGRLQLQDAPYDMFCMPYGELDIYKNGTKLSTSNQYMSLLAAYGISNVLTGSNALYDIQLVPYCPVRNMIDISGRFDIGDRGESVINWIRGESADETMESILIWSSQSTFTFNIENQIIIDDPKISNQLDVYRLCSPNYNSAFEFSPAMNNGLDFVNVDCSYKPYNPYIHLNPDFKHLYGQDFNDNRGLICGGDFSLPQINNAWETYQIQNKNYSSMFEREIQNMQVQNKYQNIQAGVSAATGTVGGIVAGNMAGGVPGAIAGGLASLGGGIADNIIQRKLQAEALDYKSDMYGMQLGNIKAMPNTLTRSSAFTPNNKIFPFIEYYTCTEQERQAFINKLKYNGMTVGRIGTINEFLSGINEYQYIKGRLIRVEGIVNDFNYIAALSDEIYKGAFFK